MAEAKKPAELTACEAIKAINDQPQWADPPFKWSDLSDDVRMDANVIHTFLYNNPSPNLEDIRAHLPNLLKTEDMVIELISIYGIDISQDDIPNEFHNSVRVNRQLDLEMKFYVSAMMGDGLG